MRCLTFHTSLHCAYEADPHVEVGTRYVCERSPLLQDSSESWSPCGWLMPSDTFTADRSETQHSRIRASQSRPRALPQLRHGKASPGLQLSVVPTSSSSAGQAGNTYNVRDSQASCSQAIAVSCSACLRPDSRGRAGAAIMPCSSITATANTGWPVSCSVAKAEQTGCCTQHVTALQASKGSTESSSEPACHSSVRQLTSILDSSSSSTAPLHAQAPDQLQAGSCSLPEDEAGGTSLGGTPPAQLFDSIQQSCYALHHPAGRQPARDQFEPTLQKGVRQSEGLQQKAGEAGVLHDSSVAQQPPEQTISALAEHQSTSPSQSGPWLSAMQQLPKQSAPACAMLQPVQPSVGQSGQSLQDTEAVHQLQEQPPSVMTQQQSGLSAQPGLSDSMQQQHQPQEAIHCDTVTGQLPQHLEQDASAMAAWLMQQPKLLQEVLQMLEAFACQGD